MAGYSEQHLVDALVVNMVDNSPYSSLAYNGEAMPASMRSAMEASMQRLATPIHEHIVSWATDMGEILGFEPALGNPPQDDYVLASSRLGVRKWVPVSGGLIMFTYTFQYSLVGNYGLVNLVNDVAEPGNSKYYGTNASGTRGWYTLGAGSSYTFRYSLTESSGLVNLMNDIDLPGNNYYYGTNAVGNKGWFPLSAGSSYTFRYSLTEVAGLVNLVNDAASPGNNKLYGTNATGVRGWYDIPTGGSYTDEQAQDAINAMLIDTNTINFTYTDATPELKFDVISQMSITSNASGIMFVNDSASPGNSKLYGTNSSGVKGWYDQPSAGTPDAHHLTHENGGADEISVAGLSGLLADSQTPISHTLVSAYHTASGLTPGYFLKALTSTTFGFAAHGLTYSDVGAAASSHNHSGIYEPVLGNPAVSGYVLSSTTGGIRSWIPMTGGGTTPVDSTLLDWATDRYQPYASAGSGRLYTGATNPSFTTRLNYDGNFYAYILEAVSIVYVGTSGAVSQTTIGPNLYACAISGTTRAYLGPQTSNGPTAIAYLFDTYYSFTDANSKIFSVKTAGTEKFFITGPGLLYAPALPVQTTENRVLYFNDTTGKISHGPIPTSSSTQHAAITEATDIICQASITTLTNIVSMTPGGDSILVIFSAPFTVTAQSQTVVLYLRINGVLWHTTRCNIYSNTQHITFTWLTGSGLHGIPQSVQVWWSGSTSIRQNGATVGPRQLTVIDLP